MIYIRKSHHTLFLLPAIAVGIDVQDGRPFFEVAWLSWAIGIGDKRMTRLTLLLALALTACGGGGSQDECKAPAQLVVTPNHDHQCLNPNSLSPQDGRQQG